MRGWHVYSTNICGAVLLQTANTCWSRTYPFAKQLRHHIDEHTSAAEGAARETWEEARARVSILAPYAHYDIPRIGQVCQHLPGSLWRCMLGARRPLTRPATTQPPCLVHSLGMKAAA